MYSEAAGIGRIVPAAVAVPMDADDVITLVKWASGNSLSLVPRGSGSSMAGGAIGPGVIVDMSRMKSIGEVDASANAVWCGPGAIQAEVNRVASQKGLRFPCDPSSGAFCTIGGMVSTNAAGARTLKFGAMRSWVLALDCVFEDGSRAIIERGAAIPANIPAIERFDATVRGALSNVPDKLGRHPGVLKDSSGYGIAAFRESGDLIDLLVGSEGTLALIVGVKLSLAAIPAATSGVLGTFASLDDAVRAAVLARDSGAVACELLDKSFLEVAAGGVTDATSAALASVPPGTEAVLLAEVEGASAREVERTAKTLSDKFIAAGATSAEIALSAAEQKEIWELRHAASPILSKLDPSLKSMQFVEDGAVPPDKLADYVRGVRAALAKHELRGVIFGHAGDSHVHVNPLVDVSAPDWRAKVEGLLADIVLLTTKLGGTLAGEHGDGRLRTPLLFHVWDHKSLELFGLVKSAFDPRGILNTGVKVPLPNQRPVADVKYDPSLAPLPERARAALDRVSDARDYSALRLDLL